MLLFLFTSRQCVRGSASETDQAAAACGRWRCACARNGSTLCVTIITMQRANRVSQRWLRRKFEEQAEVHKLRQRHLWNTLWVTTTNWCKQPGVFQRCPQRNFEEQAPTLLPGPGKDHMWSLVWSCSSSLKTVHVSDIVYVTNYERQNKTGNISRYTCPSSISENHSVFSFTFRNKYKNKIY